MNKSKIIFSLFSLFLLCLLISKANIQVFEYRITDSQQSIISSMENSIKEFDILGYNVERLKDILDEARYYSGKDNDKFFETTSLFRNTTLQVSSIIEGYYTLNNTLLLFSRLNMNISQETSDSANAINTYLILGEYEKSEILITDTKIKLKETADLLYSDSFVRAEEIGARLNEISNNSFIITDLKKQIKKDRDNEDFMDLNAVLEEINSLDHSIDEISEIKTHALFFEEKGINTARVKDIFDESIYYLERKRYEKIDELFITSKKLYDDAKEYERKYNLITSDLKSLSSERSDQTLQGFIDSLEESHKLYLGSDFEEASSSLQELDKKIIDYRSENIAFSSVGLTRNAFFKAIRDNLIIIIIAFVFFVGLLAFSWKPLFLLYTKNSIRKYEKKKEALIKVMKDLQEKYFVNRTISKKSYDYQIKAYQKNFVEITRKIALLKENSVLNKK
jgi:hypothetical protein